MNYDTRVLAPDGEALQLAARLFQNGELVAFPTETVYGLGANALDPSAVLRIFAAKGRPADNPLIVHIWHEDQLEPLCEVTDAARRLMAAFWPGPLTLLLPRKARQYAGYLSFSRTGRDNVPFYFRPAGKTDEGLERAFFLPGSREGGE